jgi:NDP-sugar pyrophosphorylase family protein
MIDTRDIVFERAGPESYLLMFSRPRSSNRPKYILSKLVYGKIQAIHICGYWLDIDAPKTFHNVNFEGVHILGSYLVGRWGGASVTASDRNASEVRNFERMIVGSSYLVDGWEVYEREGRRGGR